MIHEKLRDRTSECQALKQQIEDYAMHVGRVEDLLAQKVSIVRIIRYLEFQGMLS